MGAHEGGKARFYVMLAGILVLCTGIVGIELGILAHYDASITPDIFEDSSYQMAVVIGGAVLFFVGTAIVLREFRGYKMCPACGNEIFDAGIQVCPSCGRQIR